MKWPRVNKQANKPMLTKQANHKLTPQEKNKNKKQMQAL